MDLKQYIIDNRMTVRQFSDLTGVPWRTVYNIINGAAPTMHYRSAIEKATNGQVELKNITKSR